MGKSLYRNDFENAIHGLEKLLWRSPRVDLRIDIVDPAQKAQTLASSPPCPEPFPGHQKQ